MSLFERLFQLQQHGTTVRTELLAGVTTFLTMSYIVFVNPEILGTTGMDAGAVFVATCLAAALGSAVMALAANFPVGMAPGMGLNAFFTFTVVGAAGLPWQQALAAVFISGLVFLVLSLTGVRAWLVSGIPSSLRSAIVAGIGLFLAIIALQKSGVIVGNEDTLVALGPLNTAPPLLALAGFLLIAVLEVRRVRGAILIGILAVTGAGWALGDVQYQGLVSLPPSLAPTFLQLDLPGLLHHDGGAPIAVLLQVVLVFVLVEVFDATGTLYGVVGRAGLLKRPARRSVSAARCWPTAPPSWPVRCSAPAAPRPLPKAPRACRWATAPARPHWLCRHCSWPRCCSRRWRRWCPAMPPHRRCCSWPA